MFYILKHKFLAQFIGFVLRKLYTALILLPLFIYIYVYASSHLLYRSEACTVLPTRFENKLAIAYTQE